MDLEVIIMLSEISQMEKDKYSIISLVCGIIKNKQNKNKLVEADKVDAMEISHYLLRHSPIYLIAFRDQVS